MDVRFGGLTTYAAESRELPANIPLAKGDREFQLRRVIKKIIPGGITDLDE